LRLPYGEMTFTVGELEGVSQYLSCSLMSPLSHSMSAQEGVRLTDDCARMLLSLPVSDPNAPQLNRRALLLGRRNCENA
jgi:[NiFe] hydrogenase assembly HybE family chaperone